MNFNFESPAQIIFGSKKSQLLPELIAPFGKNIFIITGKSQERYELIVQSLKKNGCNVSIFNIAGEPSIETVDQASLQAKQAEASVVLGVGGGSVIDTAKAVSVMLTNGGSVLDYLEVIGEGQAILNPSLPCIALPTTSGTGSEVTKNSVLFSAEHKLKVSMRSPYMIPTIALIDPELTLSLPPQITAYTGMDAFTQVIEPFVSCQSTIFTDALCTDALSKAGSALLESYISPENVDARTILAYVSLIGGLALANAKLGAVHGFAGVIGGLFNAPHGAVCAALLPHVVEVNINALNVRGTEQQKQKYQQLACLITNNNEANVIDSVSYLKKLNQDLGNTGLSSYGVTSSDILKIISAAKTSSSMKGNSLILTDKELENILLNSL